MAKYSVPNQVHAVGPARVCSGKARHPDGRAALTQTIEGMGGTLEGFYYALGDDDLILIADIPDEPTATSIALNIAAAGALEVSTTVLLTPETIDEAIGKSVTYRLPGA